MWVKLQGRLQADKTDDKDNVRRSFSGCQS